MKKIYYIILILITIIPTSCDNNSEIVAPTNTDSELQKQIIGTWEMQGGDRILIYKSDSTFIDSSKSFVAYGTYSIKDSILFKSNITLRYVDPSYYPGGYNFTFESKYLKFSDSIMTEISVEVFESDSGNNNELWGRWSKTEWEYVMRYDRPSYLGRIKLVRTFVQDTKSAFWWSELIDRTPYTISDTLWSYRVNYNPPILDLLGTGDDLVKVEFSNGKMYWWESYPPIQYNRMK